MDRLVQQKLKLDRRKSAYTVIYEFEKDLGVHIIEPSVKRQAHKVKVFGRVALKKPYVNKRPIILNASTTQKKCYESLWVLGILLFGRTNQSSTYLGLMDE